LKPPTPDIWLTIEFISFISDDQPFSKVINNHDRYYDGLSVHIDGTIPCYVPNDHAFGYSPSPVTPVVAQPANKATGSPGNDEEQDLENEELPLIKLPFGAWKCGLCEKQLRRKHRAVVHFLNKHGDMRLSCQGRCGSTDWCALSTPDPLFITHSYTSVVTRRLPLKTAWTFI
jgi:ribosomal protein S27AE